MWNKINYHQLIRTTFCDHAYFTAQWARCTNPQMIIFVGFDAFSFERFGREHFIIICVLFVVGFGLSLLEFVL